MSSFLTSSLHSSLFCSRPAEDRLLGQIAAAFGAREANQPDLLAHLIQFVTPGEILRLELPPEQRDALRTVGERVIHGGRMAPLYPKVLGHWMAFLEGKVDRSVALDWIAAEFRVVSSEF